MPPSDAPEPPDAFEIENDLPEVLPPDPLPIFGQWCDEARQRQTQPNTNAFTLATVGPDGRPAARILLAKMMDLSPGAGYIVFFTNYEGRKARELDANPNAAAVFHWDHLRRQVRLEGPVVRSPEPESDAYFATRPLDARIGAWASDQTRPIESRQALIEKVVDTMATLSVSLDDPEGSKIQRPPFWGGYRLWIGALELWLGGPARVHDRARWERPLTPTSDGFTPGPWTSTRLQP